MMSGETSRASIRPAVAGALLRLRQFTPARIALGRTGTGQPTTSSLRFMMDHARARDAVHAAIDSKALARSLGSVGWSVVHVHSTAAGRAEYLRRPDLGRYLSPESRLEIESNSQANDVTIVAADGLSATAINSNLLPLLDHLRPLLLARGRAIAPIVLVEQGRVAIGDEIGELSGAKLVVVVVGERPGLSSVDSLGAYITWQPRVGTMDSSRNCVSNIRPGGLLPRNAAAQIADVIEQAFMHTVTGVRLANCAASKAVIQMDRVPGRLPWRD